MMLLKTLITVFFIVIIFTTFSFADIINVPSEQYPTIQAGIDSSTNGDTVLVDPGTYVENINFNGKSIVIGSLFLTTGEISYITGTIIDGNQTSSVVTFSGGEDSTTLLCGFTLQNGSAEMGGGIYCDEANPRLRNLIISNNSAESDGGGMTFIESSVLIEKVTVEGNSAETGAGIFSAESNLYLLNVTINNNSALRLSGGIGAHFSNLQIDSCTFTNNNAQDETGGAFTYINDGDPGPIGETFTINITNCNFKDNTANVIGGVFILKFTDDLTLIDVFIDKCEFINNSSDRNTALRIKGEISFTLSNNVFKANRATRYAAGCGFSRNCSGNVYNCLFAFNEAAIGDGEWNSGAVSVWSEADVDFINCTFADNSATYGSGLTVGNGGIASLTNCIFWGNSTDQIALDTWDNTGGTLTVSYCDVEGGQNDVNIIDEMSTLIWGEGNIDRNPLFVDLENEDFHLTDYSLCIGSGTTTGAPATDIEGNPRPDPPGSNPDMGAYENSLSAPLQEPNIVVSEDTLDFGQAFLGFTDSLELVVRNTGSEDLLISNATTNLTEYAVSPSFTDIDPGKSEIFTVSFLPQTVGDYPGTLTFSSNDPDSSTYIVTLTGQGVEPPIISVSTDSMNADLFTGATTTQTLTIFNIGASDLIWQINLENIGLGTVTFTKQDYADWTDPANQDRITDNVYITRANTQGIFNAVTETEYDWDSPDDTEWAFGFTEDLNPEDYQIWRNAVYGYPPSMVGQPISLHLISDDKYLDMMFHSWTSGGNGGGFSYTRTDVFPRWLEVSEDSGIVPAGSSIDIEVTLDATGLFGGDYFADIIIFSNDPDNQTVTIPAHLHVIGAPNLSVESDTLDFGQVFLDVTRSIDLIVNNNGTQDLLIFSAVADPAEYTVSPSFSGIDPGESEIFTVSFLPQSVGDYPGTLTLISNDPDSSTYVVTLVGQGVEPPIIGITPDSLFQELLTSEVDSQMITISNTGGSDLQYFISSQVSEINIPSMVKFPDQNTYLSDKRQLSKDMISGFSWGEIPFQTSSIIHVDKQLGLEKQGLHLPIIINDPVGDAIGGEPIVDVTLVRGASSADYLHIMIEFATIVDPFDFIVILSLDIDQDSSTGVPPYYGLPTQDIGAEFEVFFFNLDQDSVVYLLDRIKGEFVAIYPLDLQTYSIGFSIPLADLGGDDGSIDITGLVGNNSEPTDWFPDVGHGTTGVSWISVNPVSGIIPPGSSADVYITFNAEGLFGGDYRADVNTVSNDPANPVVSVKTYLHVTGRSIVALDKDSVDFGVSFVGFLDSTLLKISNMGTDVLEITDIATGDHHLTFSPPSLSIPVLSSDSLTLYLLTETEGAFSSTISFSTNDPDEGTIEIPVKGRVIEPPVISVSPDVLYADLSEGENKTQMVTIYNNGGSGLEFNASIAGDADNFALQFDGNDDYIIAGDSSFPEGSEARTITVWFKTSMGVEGETLIHYGNGTEDYQEIYLSVADRIVEVGTGGENSHTYGSSFVNDGDWHFAAATFDGTSWRLYVDGEEEETRYEGGTSPTTNTVLTGTTTIGYIFHGTIDEIRIWNVVRTETEIQADMYREIPGNEPGLVGYWRFNEGSGNITLDQTSNNNDGSLQGGPTWVVSTAPILTWLSVDPASGTVSANDSLDLNVTFDASGLSGDDYNTNVIVSHNDPGASDIIIPVYLTVISGIEDPFIDKIPKTYVLFQNFPNPFNPITHIRFGLPKATDVEIELYNILGQKVVTLFDAHKPAGYHVIDFDGNRFATGVYIYRIEAGEFQDVKKMILIR